MTEFTNQEPTVWDDDSDVTKLNHILDKMCAKKFSCPLVAIQCFRAALDFFGLTLPELEIEESGDTSPQDGPSIQSGITRPDPVAAGISHFNDYPYETLFKITDADGPDEDWDDDLYLYIAIDKVEPYYECYAQVINKNELDDINNATEEMADKDYPEVVGDESGETQYLKQTRHARGDEE